MTRDAKRRPYNATRTQYGDAKLVNTKVSIPETLRDWLDEYARKRGISRSAVIMEAIEQWVVVEVDYLESERGFSMPLAPGGLESVWTINPDGTPKE